jgi:hypothetical protein
MELLELSMVALELSGVALIKCRELDKLKLSITAIISRKLVKLRITFGRKLVKLSKRLLCRVLSTVLVNGQQ